MRTFMHIKLLIILLVSTLLSSSISYSQSLPNYRQLGLTPEEIQFLINNKTFYYAIAVDYAPIEYLSVDGEPKGFGVEYLKYASELLNINIVPVDDFENYTWTDCLNGLREGKVDILSAVSVTHNRKTFISYTKPYLTSNTLVIGNDDERLILKEDDMENTTLVFPNNYWQNEYIHSKLSNIEIINTLNMEETFNLINQNKGDYTFLESIVYNYYNQAHNYPNIKIVGELDKKAGHCLGVSKENIILRNILDKIIDYAPKEKVYAKAMTIERKQSTNKYLLYATACLVLFFLIIIVSLRKKIIASTYYSKQLEKNKLSLIENISHDLKTPLTNLKVNVDLLKHGLVNDQKLYYEKLDYNINTLNTIINDLSDIIHIQDSLAKKKYYNHFQTVNIYDFLYSFYINHEALAKSKNRNLKLIDNALKPIWVKIDQGSMYRVLSNLLSNAMKFTNENGNIELAIMPLKNKVFIHVTDNGVGISKNDLPYIFNQFYQSNEDIQGKGLGLFIAKEIIEFNNGKIEVTSKKNAFTRFSIILPIEKS